MMHCNVVLCRCAVVLHRVLRETLGAASEGGTGDCRHCIMRSFTVSVGYKKICRTCDRCGVEGKYVRDFGWETGGKVAIWNTWA